MIVPKLGHDIVARNRLKRRLREIGRRELLPRLDAGGWAKDVLIRARRGAYQMDYRTLVKDVTGVAEAMWSDES